MKPWNPGDPPRIGDPEDREAALAAARKVREAEKERQDAYESIKRHRERAAATVAKVQASLDASKASEGFRTLVLNLDLQLILLWARERLETLDEE